MVMRNYYYSQKAKPIDALTLKVFRPRLGLHLIYFCYSSAVANVLIVEITPACWNSLTENPIFI